MTITVDQLVAREVHYCVSALVSTVAEGYGALDSSTANLSDAAEQAFELCSPILDYESAAIEAGWTNPCGGETYRNKRTGERFSSPTGWQEICEGYDIEPHERDVFEHWVVSDWLADRLAEQGEKIDKDFCGLTVWARTTTGQGIASDSVIERIHADLAAS